MVGTASALAGVAMGKRVVDEIQGPKPSHPCFRHDVVAVSGRFVGSSANVVVEMHGPSPSHLQLYLGQRWSN